MKTLVVDDEQSMTEFLSILLSKEGYRVLAANSGPEALQKIKQAEEPTIINSADKALKDLDARFSATVMAENKRAEKIGEHTKTMLLDDVHLLPYVVDVLEADVIWTSEFAGAGLLAFTLLVITSLLSSLVFNPLSLWQEAAEPENDESSNAG